jgi:hypothetical protein
MGIDPKRAEKARLFHKNFAGELFPAWARVQYPKATKGDVS